MTLADGRTLQLMFKDLSRACLDEDALRVKPAFLHDPLREIEVYRDLLDGAGLGTPAYYGASVDPARRPPLAVHRERRRSGAVAGRASSRSGRRRPAGSRGCTPRWRPAASGAPALRCCATGPTSIRTWIDRARRVRRARRRRPGATRPAQRSMDLSDALRARRRAARGAAPTIVHGEFYPSNVLVQDRRRSAIRIAPIDWEIAARRPGAPRPRRPHDRQVDAGAARRAGARLPRGRRGRARAPPPARPTSTRRSSYCRLHLAVQALGWEPGVAAARPSTATTGSPSRCGSSASCASRVRRPMTAERNRRPAAACSTCCDSPCPGTPR